MKTFTTSQGIEVEFRAISKDLILRFNVANPQPGVPTYSVTSELTGATQEIPLDEKSLQEKPEQFSAEHHAAWKSYSEKQAEYVLRFIRFFCLRGLKVHSTMDDWLEEQAFLGIPPPTNKAELRFEWLTNVVLSTEEDYRAVILGIMETSGVSNDLLQQIEASFRGDVSGNGAEPAGDGSKSLAGVNELGGGASYVALADDFESMGTTQQPGQGVGTEDTRDIGHDASSGNCS